MMAFGRVTGTIWTETSRARRLDDGHVRLLLAVAALAGMARAQAEETARLQQTNEVLQAQINLDHDMIGGSKPMQLLFERIARVAKTDSTILIRGESGTGKELVAAPCTATAGGPIARLWPSTARPSPKRFLNRNCSVTRKAHLPARLG
jgi:transcriptional regulator with GAF, ATPase, and Fis domain